KTYEPAIYRNVIYDVDMNDHLRKYFDNNTNIKIYLPASNINSPGCRPVIVTLSNSDELFVYYFEEDSDINMHNVYFIKFCSI
ncbi:unnamed protein product, partial [Rotaria sp. Silwood1]